MIEDLRLYQIPGSHYCDKVRWALDLKKIPYELINFNIFGETKGLERASTTISKLMPTLEDPNRKEKNKFQCESTPILIYLDTEYSQLSLSLFPSSSSEQRQRIIDTCFRLDSELGLYVRRLAYVQFLKEKASVLSVLLGETFPWAYNPNDIRSRLISPFIACLMISRCRLHRIREDHLREKTECILLEIGEHLRTNDYLVGEQFSAADLTFCSLVKPLERVPCFSGDDRFRIIFDYHQRIRQNFDPKYPNIDSLLEKIVDQERAHVKKNEKNLTTRIKIFIHRINFVQQFFFWIMTMVVSKIYGPTSDDQEKPQFKIPSPSYGEQQEPLNDQRVANITSKWSMITFLFRYMCHLVFTIPTQAPYLNEKT